ncbi:hypothetical protein [Lactiplantibacillus mudanjiangensis]|uniref:Uncharacterized protein n=1 Tax=Lactiplantibacillus mudanjiangensis TaxID=1296538 RepID=A0A660DVB6_9LACO|nr:hypothetical protein [Lactiplantibacillus mudanjiangensis]VDG20858.1 hypothetical protein MUDAN_BIHEEGNE_02490 [Lactiplantibacillus mudanjiangensis]VDG22588.1 hypothetical protein MUDAN_IGPPGNFN_00136 [Lactiplantibacillus mudanjiangensis]VDG26874.1 hypothetical protein MUDAN_MDHGFNIF_00271 [Lactiplantibacillus mudanjiangensis]VDG32013.1 hypothetical protein MUDAN_DOGOELCO_01304 [Lactiplantibacillus mudanjiangensis]
MNERTFAIMIGILLIFAGYLNKKKRGKTDSLSVGMGIFIILLAVHAFPFLSY